MRWHHIIPFKSETHIHPHVQQRFPSPAYVPACSPLNATVLLLSLSPGLRGHGGRHAGRAGPPAAPRLPVRAGSGAAGPAAGLPGEGGPLAAAHLPAAGPGSGTHAGAGAGELMEGLWVFSQKQQCTAVGTVSIYNC